MKDHMLMSSLLKVLVSVSVVLLCSCAEGDNTSPNSNSDLGTVEIKFDNIVGDESVIFLSEPGGEEYDFINSFGQPYNLTLIKYIVSEIVFEGPDGELFVDELDISGDEVKGYYLINEADFASQRIVLNNVPKGIYNKVRFKIGIEEEGVEQGASIILGGMFWAWNSGYIGMKVEGQSSASRGQSFGDTIEETNPNGFAYHIGGWNSPNNIREVSIAFDDLIVSTAFKPELHLVFDIAKFIDGREAIDFEKKNSVHDPSAGSKYADNLLDLVGYDHIHNNPL